MKEDDSQKAAPPAYARQQALLFFCTDHLKSNQFFFAVYSPVWKNTNVSQWVYSLFNKCSVLDTPLLGLYSDFNLISTKCATKEHVQMLALFKVNVQDVEIWYSDSIHDHISVVLMMMEDQCVKYVVLYQTEKMCFALSKNYFKKQPCLFLLK